MRENTQQILFDNNFQRINTLNTHVGVFCQHWEVTFHARIFGRFFWWCIVFNYIPKSHHIIYIEIPHRFHLQFENKSDGIGHKKKKKISINQIVWFTNLVHWISYVEFGFFHQIHLIFQTNQFFSGKKKKKKQVIRCSPVDNTLVSRAEMASDGIYYSRKKQQHVAHENHWTTMPASIQRNTLFDFAFFFWFNSLFK